MDKLPGLLDCLLFWHGDTFLKALRRRKVHKTQISEYAGLAATGRCSAIVLGISSLGRVYQSDGIETWPVYYCQVGPETIFTSSGLILDEEFAHGNGTTTELHLYWFSAANGKRIALGAVWAGEALQPCFTFPEYTCQWPYLPAPCFRGRLEDIAKDPKSLAAPPVSEEVAQQLELLIAVAR